MVVAGEMGGLYNGSHYMGASRAVSQKSGEGQPRIRLRVKLRRDMFARMFSNRREEIFNHRELRGRREYKN